MKASWTNLLLALADLRDKYPYLPIEQVVYELAVLSTKMPYQCETDEIHAWLIRLFGKEKSDDTRAIQKADP